jgi:hypothetical protein
MTSAENNRAVAAPARGGGPWLAIFSGHLDLPSALTPIDRRMHELVYGYVPAAVIGWRADCRAGSHCHRL